MPPLLVAVSHTHTHTLAASLYLSQMVFWLSCCLSFSVTHTQLLALIYLSMFSCSCCRQTLRPCYGTIVSNNNLYLLCNQFATNYSCFSYFLVAVAFLRQRRPMILNWVWEGHWCCLHGRRVVIEGCLAVMLWPDMFALQRKKGFEMDKVFFEYLIES